MTSNDSDQPVHPNSMARVLVYPSLNSPGGCRRHVISEDVQADLCWLHKSNCRLCHGLAHTFLWRIKINVG